MIPQLLFTACLALFIAHQLLQKVLNISLPYVDSYLDPLLCMPILLYLLLIERSYFWKQKVTSLSSATIIAATVFIIVISEIFFPLYTTAFVFDEIDIALYFLGAGFYYSCMNKLSTENKL
jgi:hypothetical protein